jgi:hypothetical protein
VIIVVSDWSFVVGKKIDLVSERDHANISGRGTTSVGWMAYKGDGPWCRLVVSYWSSVVGTKKWKDYFVVKKGVLQESPANLR